VIVDADVTEELFAESWVIKYDAEVVEAACELAHEKVQTMHTKNGLWEELLAGGCGKPLAEVEAEMCEIVRHFALGVTEDGNGYRSPLLGSNVGFDRNWLKYHTPGFIRLLDYHNIDVSTVREIVKRRYCKQFQFKANSKASHRVLDDIRYSIAALQYYYAHVFSPYGTAGSIADESAPGAKASWQPKPGGHSWGGA
jgi:oligoribonuclease (3'-5' exoribonuclease)